MADILIKGMEMPKTCRRCMEMGIPVRCRVMEQEAVTAVMSGYDRPSDCPLVALPEHHGRLGDLDAIRESLSSDCPCRGCERFHEEGVCMNCQWDRFAKLIDEAPTVLEASNGTDN